MISVDEDVAGPMVTPETFCGLHDAASLDTEGSPRTLVVESGAADQDNGTKITIRLLLLQSGTQVVLAGVAVGAEKGVIRRGGGIPVGEEQDRSCGKLAEKVANDGFSGGGETELYALFEKGGGGEIRASTYSAETFGILRGYQGEIGSV